MQASTSSESDGSPGVEPSSHSDAAIIMLQRQVEELSQSKEALHQRCRVPSLGRVSLSTTCFIVCMHCTVTWCVVS